MNYLHPVLGLLFLIVSYFKYASSIMCYDCNSAFDPRCGPEFDPFSLGVINCSLKEPLEHMPGAVPTLCRTIKMEIKEKVRVVRKCGYTELDVDMENKPGCKRASPGGDTFVTYCACDTDLCNEGHKSHVSKAILGFLCLSVLRVFIVD